MSLIFKFVFISPCIFAMTYAAPQFVETTSISVNCGAIGDCLTVAPNCSEPCGCDYLYHYNRILDKCILNKTYLALLMVEKKYTYHISDSDKEETLRYGTDHAFKGVLIGALVFVICASVCVVSASVYCCHISYSDRKLEKEVKSQAEKLHRDGKLKKTIKKRTEDVAQSCNVIVEDAGVFVC